ncbi:nucleoside deaminase [Roseiflexus castenholzii]|uniref:CMP/dCMP deaminase zinc-binding n=1 Tax=Roseiflexus castenholzii (strain DSM 13941 / HLO8) TaxID=383372 RepID=A7NMJ4_ROSCS|nr:nucleoside deaminase [Roseiflexus castenholzii]ABU58756.1 CMP/dCMP deaminase zinc-binding [Roseiflexus castenholzii DSM 13941]
MNRHVSTLTITLPDWLNARLTAPIRLPSDEDRMRFVIDLARTNIAQGTGGPFAAAVFRSDDGVLVSAGVNSVTRLTNAVLHAEVVALMFAQARVGAYTLRAANTSYDLVTSCEPCAMCLGAILWSGVQRLVCGATRDDAERIGFDEGPVFPESYAYLERRGITVVRQVLRAEAANVLDHYRRSGGVVYNG